MAHYLIEQGYIPLDKSLLIRFGVLDLLEGYKDTIQFLYHQKPLSNDLQSLYHASLDWNSGAPVRVGESGTLYRFLKFACWKNGLNKNFLLSGTLRTRQICNDPEIVNYSLKDLLKLDNGTSQWASASVLLGNEEIVENPPEKLKLTYEAVSHWKQRRAQRLSWEPRYDETILGQAEAFIELMKYGKTEFRPKHSEDACFAIGFGLMSIGEAENKWPSLRGHESNRTEEMKNMLLYADQGKDISSKDHRVVQAIAMRQKLDKEPVIIEHPKVVNKSWPQFWKFLEYSSGVRNTSS